MFDLTSSISRFNTMYRLPVATRPSTRAIGDPTAVGDRIRAFSDILREEIQEGAAIVSKLESATFDEVEVLTELADWLGDIVVYCHSEAAKFGLPMDLVLAKIMQSNFSKLGEDGKPIYDGRGKVMKGPKYFKPEPAIRAMLLEHLNAFDH